MTLAVLYRWRVDAAKAKQFKDAWAEGTRLIHEKCGSYGARLHKGADGLYWSYALWPDEAARKRCFEDKSVMKRDCFALMQDAVVEHFDEIAMEPCVDELRAMPENDDD